MNPNLRVLAALAEDVEGRADVRLDEVRARIRSARRRRQLAAVAGTAVAVVVALTAGTVAMSVLDRDASGPATPPGPAVTPTEQPPAPGPRSSRPLVWARGQTVHVGDRQVDVGGKVWEVQGTDDGAAFIQARRSCFRMVDRAAVPVPAAGCNELYFTDGDGIEHIGTVYGSLIRSYEISGSTSGSTLVWFEPAPQDHPGGSGYERTGEYVVYDTRERREVARFGSEAGDPNGDAGFHLRIEAVFDDAVYWTPDDRGREWCAGYSRYYGMCRRHTAVIRLDTSTGIQTKVGWSAYLEDRHSRPRAFLRTPDTPDSPYNPFPENRAGYETLELERVGDRLVASDENGEVVGVRVAGTGRPVRLRVPPGYRPSGVFRVMQWLDDDRVVVLPEESEDLLACRLSTGRCRVAATGVAVASFRSYG